MKKILCLLVLIPFFTACSDDDEKEKSEFEKNIIGAWEWEKTNYFIDGEITNSIRDAENLKDTLTFREDGIYIKAISFQKEGEQVEYNRIDGPYKINGNVLSFISEVNIIYLRKEEFCYEGKMSSVSSKATYKRYYRLLSR